MVSKGLRQRVGLWVAFAAVGTVAVVLADDTTVRLQFVEPAAEPTRAPTAASSRPSKRKAAGPVLAPPRSKPAGAAVPEMAKKDAPIGATKPSDNAPSLEPIPDPDDAESGPEMEEMDATPARPTPVPVAKPQLKPAEKPPESAPTITPPSAVGTDTPKSETKPADPAPTSTPPTGTPPTISPPPAAITPAPTEPALLRPEPTMPPAAPPKPVEPAAPEANPPATSLPPAETPSEVKPKPSMPPAEPQPLHESVPESAKPPKPTPSATSRPAPAKPPVDPDYDPTLTPELKALRDRVRRTLTMYYPRKLNTRDHNNWEAMHSIIAYGVHSELLRDGPYGQPVNSVAWICYNNPCKNDRMLYLDRGRIMVKKGVGVQGHHGQFLAIIAQSRVPKSYEFTLEGQRFTVADLIESEKLGCETDMELTFKLIAIAHYCDLNEKWFNDQGEEWSVSRLVHEEIQSPIRGAACGGTHRLMGLAYAVQKRRIRGQAIDGEFARAAKYLQDFHQYTYSLQNHDGSFSTEWFVRRGDRPDLDRKLQTTGHILEWLVFSLSPEELDDPRVIRAVNFLSGILQQNRTKKWEIGPLGHALHALALYEERMFGLPASAAPAQATPIDEARAPTPKMPSQPLMTEVETEAPRALPSETEAARPLMEVPPPTRTSPPRTAAPPRGLRRRQ